MNQAQFDALYAKHIEPRFKTIVEKIRAAEGSIELAIATSSDPAYDTEDFFEDKLALKQEIQGINYIMKKFADTEGLKYTPFEYK